MFIKVLAGIVVFGLGVDCIMEGAVIVTNRKSLDKHVLNILAKSMILKAAGIAVALDALI